jgi:hypothetical protein
MEELIFFAVIIFFSIIESIARRRKGKRQGEDESSPELPEPDRWERQRWEPSKEVEVATYDDEASYDEHATAESTGPKPPTPRRPSSETMLPLDLLEDLAGLAGGLQKERTQPAPAPPVPRHTQRPLPQRRPAPPVARPPLTPRTRREQLPEKMREPHRVHLSHAEYGTDPSERSRSAQDVLNRPPAWHDPDAAAVHRQLRSGSGSALRQAIILQEVLGPPMALRDERFED